ncbi:MAG TPA: OmpA family protein [Pseudomonadales bacterium]
MKKILLSTFALVCMFVLIGCESMYTTDPYTGEKQLSKTVKYGATAALGCAAAGALSTDEGKNKRARNSAVACGAAGAAYGNYTDRQEAKLRQVLEGSGVQVTRVGKDVHLNLPGNITFATGSFNIQPGFLGTLDSIALVLKEFNKTSLQVIGYTDSVGSDAFNQSLSERRAQSIAQYITSQGVPPIRVVDRGMGERNPIASNNSESGRSANRRIEMQLINPGA